jgi:hypothetical protein
VRARGPTIRGGVAALVLVALVALLGCTPTVPTSPAVAIPTPTPSPVASPPSTPSPSPASATASGRVDSTLLDALPREIDGQALRPDDESAAAIENLPADVEALAIGLYIRPGSSAADDFAIVNVARLQAGVFDEGWFRSWRDTYDRGACEVAGGVAPGSTEAEIAGHATHIESCQGGVHLYHVHLTDPDRVVSITAAGDGRFGERVVAGLTE